VTTLATLQSLIAQGESETLELERSTAELRRAGETLCAFLNGDGGKVLIVVAPDGRLVGQDVADITLRDIAAMLGRFEPPARVEMSRVDVGNGRQELLTQEHRSIPRNPLIAGAFHRTGAIEVWGRGTNRVVEACRAYGVAEPTFTEASGAVTVTFKAEVVAAARDLVPGGDQVGTKSGPSSSARSRGRFCDASRTNGAVGAHEPDQVPGPSRGAPAGCRPPRNDHRG
jgi:predicted HTH transcriptional regulator